MVHVVGTVIYCDECGEKGPGVVGDDAESVSVEAQIVGWDVQPDGKDLCLKCAKP